MSQQGRLKGFSLNPLDTLTGDAGGAVSPDASDNIDILGDGVTITTTGNPATSTITISSGATVPTTFDADSGSAVPAAGILIVAGGTGVDTSGAGNTITVDAAADVATTYPTDSGTATPAANALTVAGGTLLNTSGAGATVTVNADGEIAASFPTDSGTATPAANALTVLGQSGILTTTGAAATVTVNATADFEETAMHGWNGSILETAAVTVTSDGATITFSVEQNGGGNLTVVFSDGYYDWTTAPDTITLTAGSDPSPQTNYVYFLQSTKLLTVSTVSFPAAEHAPLATVICQSAASLQTEGAYKVHAWTDHVVATSDQGHVSDLNLWVREQPATWSSGVVQTYTITPNGGSADNVLLTTASGTVLQLHPHAFPAFGGTPDYYVINDSVTPYTIVTDLNALLTDSAGGSMSGRYFSLVLWGVVSEDSSDSKLFINLPSGSYNNQTSVESDLQKFADYALPTDYRGTAFLISEWKLRHQVAASGTWTSIDEIDLRGILPASAGGGVTSFPSEFADNVFRIFDDGDDTKKIAFEASSITTSTVRTITMVDADIDLADVATSVPTDSGTAVPASNVLTIAGGTLLNTSGAGSTVTVNADAAVAASVPTDSGTVTPAANAFSIVGGGGVSTSGAGSVVTITAGGSVPTTFDGDTGSAVPSLNVIIIAGGTGLATSAAGNTVTVDADATVPLSFPSDSGTATPAANALTVAGGTLLGTTGAGATLTVNADGAIAASAPTDSGTATPAANALTFAGGTGISTSGAGSTVTIDASAAVPTTFGTDSGTATPAANNLDILGTGGITTSGAGDTVTIDGSSVGFAWVEETGTTANLVAGQGVIANNGTGITLTLPVTAAQGTVIRIGGIGAGAWDIAQNASQSINFLGTATTVGVGGTTDADELNGALEILCTVANTTWLVISSVGNFTIV